mmetsp:Transcript_27411/g.42803  ORF Transcript_27411/g.42803 Transcript_27411/m.42803 type:complete len:290 (+) Transcript_27411:189-1058(+)
MPITEPQLLSSIPSFLRAPATTPPGQTSTAKRTSLLTATRWSRASQLPTRIPQELVLMLELALRHMKLLPSLSAPRVADGPRRLLASLAPSLPRPRSFTLSTQPILRVARQEVSTRTMHTTLPRTPTLLVAKRERRHCREGLRGLRMPLLISFGRPGRLAVGGPHSTLGLWKLRLLTQPLCTPSMALTRPISKPEASTLTHRPPDPTAVSHCSNSRLHPPSLLLATRRQKLPECSPRSGTSPSPGTRCYLGRWGPHVRLLARLLRARAWRASTSGMTTSRAPPVRRLMP